MEGKLGQSSAWTSREKSVFRRRKQPAVADVTCHLRRGLRNGRWVGNMVVRSMELFGTIFWNCRDKRGVVRRGGELGSIFSKHSPCIQRSWCWPGSRLKEGMKSKEVCFQDGNHQSTCTCCCWPTETERETDVKGEIGKGVKFLIWSRGSRPQVEGQTSDRKGNTFIVTCRKKDECRHRQLRALVMRSGRCIELLASACLILYEVARSMFA